MRRDNNRGKCKSLLKRKSALMLGSRIPFLFPLSLLCNLDATLMASSFLLETYPKHEHNFFSEIPYSFYRREIPTRDLSSLKLTTDSHETLSNPPLSSSAANTTDLKNSFILQIETSIKEGTFISLILNGPGKAKKRKQKSKTTAVPLDDEILRGCLRQVQCRPILMKGKQFLQVTFKYHGATDIAKNWPLGNKQDMENIRNSLWCILDFPRSVNRGQNDYVPLSEWGQVHLDVHKEALLESNVLGIQRGLLTTLGSEVELDVGAHKKKSKIKEKELQSPVETIADSHDRIKKVPLDTKANFLQALGVTNDQGKPRQAMASKLRQCQKFVEIVGNLVDKVSPNLQSAGQSISVLDLGCGRGYLTFSLHAFLQAKYNHVKSVGLDMRPKLVKEIDGIARSSGDDFAALQFQVGSIEDILETTKSETEESTNNLYILIALHACDTATDDALWCGISRQADIIVVAPCCHKEIRPQLNFHLNNAPEDHPLVDILKHNVYRERHSEMVTDSMRALLLELAGYEVTVSEFIGGEHTAKNVMITAIREAATCESTNQQQKRERREENLRQRIHELATLNGISSQKLMHWMGESYLGTNNTLVQRNSIVSNGKRVSPKNMPPL